MKVVNSFAHSIPVPIPSLLWCYASTQTRACLESLHSLLEGCAWSWKRLPSLLCSGFPIIFITCTGLVPDTIYRRQCTDWNINVVIGLTSTAWMWVKFQRLFLSANFLLHRCLEDRQAESCRRTDCWGSESQDLCAWLVSVSCLLTMAPCPRKNKW